MKGTNIRAENMAKCLIFTVGKAGAKGVIFLEGFVYVVSALVCIVVVRGTIF